MIARATETSSDDVGSSRDRNFGLRAMARAGFEISAIENHEKLKDYVTICKPKIREKKPREEIS